MQVEQIYSQGSKQETRVAALNPLTGKLEEKNVVWFKSDFTRHVCLVNQDSILGLSVNPWAFSLLKYWLKAVLVPINRKYSVVDNIVDSAGKKLSRYFRQDIRLGMDPNDELQVRRIKNVNETRGDLRLPQISIDSSGFVMTRPDSFLPKCDIIRGEDYVILMDVPGVLKEDVSVTRQNVITIVKGIRKKSCFEENKETIYETKERWGDFVYVFTLRMYGEFTIRFKIPVEYERKWHCFELKEGILTLKYKKDSDDQKED